VPRPNFLDELAFFNTKLVKGELHRNLLSDDRVVGILQEEFKIIWAAIFPYLPSESQFHFPENRSRAYATPNFYKDLEGPLYSKWVEWQEKEFIDVSNIHRAGSLLHKAYQTALTHESKTKLLCQIEDILKDDFCLSLSDFDEATKDFTCISAFSLMSLGLLHLAWECHCEGKSRGEFESWFLNSHSRTRKRSITTNELRSYSNLLLSQKRGSQWVLDARFLLTKSLYLYAFDADQEVNREQFVAILNLYGRICDGVSKRRNVAFEDLLDITFEQLSQGQSKHSLKIFSAAIPFNFKTAVNLRIQNLLIKPLSVGFNEVGVDTGKSGQEENLVGLLIADLATPISERSQYDLNRRKKLGILTSYLMLPVILHDRSVKQEEITRAKEQASEMLDFAAGLSHEISHYLEPPIDFIADLYDETSQGSETTITRNHNTRNSSLRSAYASSIWLSDIIDLFVRFLKRELLNDEIGKSLIEELFSDVQNRVTRIVNNDGNFHAKLGKEKLDQIEIELDCSELQDNHMTVFDREGLKTTLVNLIVNSFKSFSPENGTYCAVRVFSDGEVMTFSVIDDGIGFTLDEAESFAKPGQQSGSGIGTKIVRMLATSFGGNIRVVQRKDPTVVELSLPLALKKR
jgi:signal transduction histidine kinase